MLLCKKDIRQKAFLYGQCVSCICPVEDVGRNDQPAGVGARFISPCIGRLVNYEVMTSTTQGNILSSIKGNLFSSS